MSTLQQFMLSNTTNVINELQSNSTLNTNLKTTLGLGTAAFKNVGTGANDVAAGNTASSSGSRPFEAF